MVDDPIYRGWDVFGKASRGIKQAISGVALSKEAAELRGLQTDAQRLIETLELSEPEQRQQLAFGLALAVLERLNVDTDDADALPITHPLTSCLYGLIENEGWFNAPVDAEALADVPRSELWEIEDELRHVKSMLKVFDEVQDLLMAWLAASCHPLTEHAPSLFRQKTNSAAITFDVKLAEALPELPAIVENIVQLPFAPELEERKIGQGLRERLQYNLVVASGGNPTDPKAYERNHKLPTKSSDIQPAQMIETYLAGTPFMALFNAELTIELPTETRFEHHHIVAGSGHGKTQTLQHLILHDLEAVAKGEASIVVIDSQSDLINNIANLEVFAPGGPLADRLVLIDPTDIEWPVALNLFDVGMDRLDKYSQLDRERLTNSILELYDFVLGSLLDAGMTQKQTVIFRYITRLLLHIPDATIHTLRELLENGGYEKYEAHINKLQGSAKAFFKNEFNGSEFKSTKRQVLRRLYGILENQTFERMFSHPNSKLDLFSEMNAGKVILINTAKDLLKENGTEIFGRFFIAMIAQAAQERAVLDKDKRLPTFVYIDEANDYFDRNIGIILSQARKYNFGMILAHQFLGQLDNKLHEAIAANTSIKFAGGVSAKDAKALANDLRTDASFIERQKKLSFAAHIKGQTERAVSIVIEPGQLEAMERMSSNDRNEILIQMRERYAVHYTELEALEPEDGTDDSADDNGKPMKWD